MATASTSGSDKNRNKDNNFVSSTYHKAVCLQDWWLIRTEKDVNGSRLAVEGLTLRDKQQAVRVFSSAPIIKRHDMFTLETVDGITVLLKGTINQTRSLENGFPSEACSHFLLGFPYYWGTYADQCDRNESTTAGPSRSMPAFDGCSLDGQAVIKTLDHLISTPEVSGDSKLTKNFDTDVLEKCSGNNLETHKMQISAEPLCYGPLPTIKEAKKISNEQENLNKDVDSDPKSVGPEITYFQEKSENGMIAIPNMQLKTEVVYSSGIEPLTTRETLVGSDITATRMHISPLKRTTSNCTDTLGNHNCEALEDRMVPTISYEDTAFPVMTKSVPAESSSVGVTKLLNSVEKSGNKQDTVKAIYGLKNKSTNFRLSEPEVYEADMEPPVEETDRACAMSTISHETLERAVENCSPSTTDELHKTLSKFGKHENSIVKDETLLKEPLCLTDKQDASPNTKDFSIPVGSDVNVASLTEVHKVVRDDPETLSRLDSSNSSMKYKRKTKLNLKSERSRDLRSCTYSTVKKDFIGHGSSSTCPDMKNHAEVKMAGSSERTKSSSTVKHTNLHSISKSQDCEAVKGTLAKEKLGKVLSVGFEETLKDSEGNVGKSVSAVSHVGSPKMSESGESRNCDTMAEPTVKLKMESNGISSSQVGTDILNSTPINSAATGASNSGKNLKVSGKNSSLAAGSESVDPISTYEVLKKSNGEHLIGKIDFSESTPRCRKMDNSKKTVKPSEATRSSSRLKNLRDRCKDQTSCSRLVNANKGNIDPELGCRSTLVETNVGRKIAHMLGNESVTSDAVGNIKVCAESSEQYESCNSLKRLGDLRNTSKMSKEHGESNVKGVGTSGSKRKRQRVDSLVSLPPLTRKRKIDSSFMSPECVSHGRSRSGRLLLRPLDFWRNEHIVYNLDGEVAGVHEGVSPVGSSSGNKPESLKTKRKQL